MSYLWETKRLLISTVCTVSNCCTACPSPEKQLSSAVSAVKKKLITMSDCCMAAVFISCGPVNHGCCGNTCLGGDIS